MLHILKLCVGISDVGQLRLEQARRAAPLRHRTRNHPRRAGEIIDGGSLYWVIAGSILVRQRITDITADSWDDATPCAAFHLDAELVAVAGRPTRAFQGWRYLAAEAAPPDLVVSTAAGVELLPETLRRALAELGLL